MARFERALGLLLGGGLGAGVAVGHAAPVTANPYIAKALLNALPRLERGATLSEAISPTAYMSDAERQMLHVGEVSGRLEESLTKSAELLEQEAISTVRILVRLLGLVLFFVVVGMLFGGILVHR